MVHLWFICSSFVVHKDSINLDCEAISRGVGEILTLRGKADSGFWFGIDRVFSWRLGLFKFLVGF